MKIAKKFVLLNLILINLFIRSSLTEEATHFTISTPKQTVLIYEPVSLTTEFDISGLAVKDLQFFLKINGKVVPDKTIIFPRYFSKTQVMKSKILKFMIELFYNTADRKYFFSTHGKYNITIHEWKTKRKSKPLILNVKNANRLEKEALQLFIGNEDKIVTFLTDKPKDTAMTDFRRLCEKYPNTVYALYASCTIAAHKFNEMLRDIKTRKKIKTLIPWFQKSAGVITGSPLDEKSYFYLAWCQALTADYANAKKNLEMLTRKYPYGKYAQKVKKILNELSAYGH